MALYTQYDAVGIKEDISDIISNISPTKTPFQAAIGNEKSTQKLFQWQEDSLRAVSDNNQAEGFEASDVAITATTMRNNVTQILSETTKVSGSIDTASAYGRAKESAYQLSKTMAQVKRDLEHAFVGTAQAKVSPSDNLSNRKMAGFQRQLLNDGGNAMSSANTVLYTGGTSTQPTEDNLLDLLEGLYDNGADPSVIMVTPTNSRVIADFAKASGRYRTYEGGATKLVNVVDIYVSPFGQQRVVINRFLLDKNTLVFEPDMWKQVTFRPWTREVLAKTGDSVKNMVLGEFSLKHKNYLASGAIVERSASANAYA
jgi:hypothetical protein